MRLSPEARAARASLPRFKVQIAAEISRSLEHVV